MKSGPRPVTAVLLMIGSSLSFALMGAAVKFATSDFPFLVSLFFRSVTGIAPLGIIVLATQGSLRSSRQALLFRRSLLGFMAMCLFFLGIEKLPLSTAVVLNQSSPVFTVVFSALILKEHKALHVLPFALVAFVGVAILVGPDLSTSGLWAMLTLVSAVLSALAYVTVKQLSSTESSAIIVFYFSVWGTLFSVVTIAVAIMFGLGGLDIHEVLFQLSSPWTLAVLFCVGLFGVLGQLLMTASYARARASMVSPFSFFNPMFSYVIGIVAFSEHVTLHGILGGLLVIVASAAVPLLGAIGRGRGRAGVRVS